jgi:signal transduction histidine kinase
MLTMIKRNADKSITMLEELRERLREKPILLEMTDLGALILKAIEDTLIPDSVNTILRLDEKLGPFMLDASQMRRVLHNLIGNALDAMPGGGELTISSERDGETVLLEVSDTGGGISEDDMKDLFSPFHSKKSGGLGLGLAFCKQTVEAHNGSITVESEIGQGTKIEIVIPMNE